MGRKSGVISAEMRFIYQVVISCLKLNLDVPTSIKILNSLIKQNNVDYPNVDVKRFNHIKYMVGVHLREYRKLKVEQSNYRNPRLRGLFYQLQIQTEDTRVFASTAYQTDGLVKQELNKILDNNKNHENKTQ